MADRKSKANGSLSELVRRGEATYHKRLASPPKGRQAIKTFRLKPGVRIAPGRRKQ